MYSWILPLMILVLVSLIFVTILIAWLTADDRVDPDFRGYFYASVIILIILSFLMSILVVLEYSHESERCYASNNYIPVIQG